MLTQTFLTKDIVYELVNDNKYVINDEKRFISRCTTGLYSNENDLPALAIPGGDLGELALLYSTAQLYGFEVDFDKAFEILYTLIGGIQHFSLHSDNNTTDNMILSGCLYINEIYTDPVEFGLHELHIKTLKKQFQWAIDQGATVRSLGNEAKVGAVLQVKGNVGIYPQYSFELDNISVTTQVYMYHQTLANERRRVYTEKLVTEKAVSLFEGCDEEYLYEVLSGEAENHLFTFLKKRAEGFPIFAVEIDQKNRIIINDLDSI